MVFADFSVETHYRYIFSDINCPRIETSAEMSALQRCFALMEVHLGKESINLVDPASSHTLKSKIKPCMSKYKQLYCETANGSLYQL